MKMNNKMAKKFFCFLMSFLLIISGLFTTISTKVSAMKPAVHNSKRNIKISDVIQMVNECTSITETEKNKIMEALNYIQMHFQPNGTQFTENLKQQLETIKVITSHNNSVAEQRSQQPVKHEYSDLTKNDQNGAILISVTEHRNLDIVNQRNNINERIDVLRDFTDNVVPELHDIIERNTALNREEKDRLQQALNAARDEIRQLEVALEIRDSTCFGRMKTRNFRYGVGFGVGVTMIVMVIIAVIVAVCVKK